jgi:hypothetical protein
VKDTRTLKEGSAVTEQSQPEWRTMGDDEDVGIWAIGLLLFAAIVLIMAGAFQAFTGLVAIFDDQFLIPTRDYLFQFDRTSWGWTHLILGVLVTAAGAGLLTGRTWARAFAIVLAVCSALAMFAFLPHYPLWAVVIITLDIAVIWAIVSQGGLGAAGS